MLLDVTTEDEFLMLALSVEEPLYVDDVRLSVLCKCDSDLQVDEWIYRNIDWLSKYITAIDRYTDTIEFTLVGHVWFATEHDKYYPVVRELLEKQKS